MTLFLAAQIVGGIGVLLSIAVFQLTTRKNMLRLGVAASLFHIAQFLLLSAFTGASMHVIGALRTYVFYKVTPTRSHVWVLVLFMIIAIIATYFTWQGWVSLLALAGNLCGGFASWHKTAKYIRRWALASPPLWFTYNLLNGAIAGMVLEVVMLSSNLVGQYRHDIGHKAHTKRRLARVG